MEPPLPPTPPPPTDPAQERGMPLALRAVLYLAGALCVLAGLSIDSAATGAGMVGGVLLWIVCRAT